MTVKVFDTYERLSRATADLIIGGIRKEGKSLICIASGHTPRGVFKCLADDANSGKLDLSNLIFVSLDEWLDIDPKDSGSCISMLRNDFFDHVKLRDDQVVLFDINAKDLQVECKRINDLIARHGGLDVMLVGIGTNGHIGMNEPGTSFDTYAHISTLAEETIVTGQKYFTTATNLSKGVTLGIRHFQEAKLPIIMANGSKKAPIIKKVIQTTTPTVEVPASVIHKTKQAYLMLDREAAHDAPIDFK